MRVDSSFSPPLRQISGSHVFGLSFSFSHQVVVHGVSIDRVSWFFKHLKTYYFELSEGHLSFDLLKGSQLEEGAEIRNQERAGGQFVRHLYKVTDFSDHYLKMVSDRSEVTGVTCCFVPYSAVAKTTVEFEFLELPEGGVQVSSRLSLVFDGQCSVLSARLVGTRGIWEPHFREELEAGAALIQTERFKRDFEAQHLC